MNAKQMIRKCSIARTFTMAAVTALALAISPTAKADDKGCSNATLQGTFAYTSTGFITAPPDFAGPFAEAGTQVFDGKGGTTAAVTLSQNGNILPVSITGTYTVNPDCTGTFTLQVSPINVTVHVFFVIDDGGDEFQAIETDPGLVITRIGRRLVRGRGV
jgi:hypothetical protein